MHANETNRYHSVHRWRCIRDFFRVCSCAACVYVFVLRTWWKMIKCNPTELNGAEQQYITIRMKCNTHDHTFVQRAHTHNENRVFYMHKMFSTYWNLIWILYQCDFSMLLYSAMKGDRMYVWTKKKLCVAYSVRNVTQEAFKKSNLCLRKFHQWNDFLIELMAERENFVKFRWRINLSNHFFFFFRSWNVERKNVNAIKNKRSKWNVCFSSNFFSSICFGCLLTSSIHSTFYNQRNANGLAPRFKTFELFSPLKRHLLIETFEIEIFFKWLIQHLNECNIIVLTTLKRKRLICGKIELFNYTKTC